MFGFKRSRSESPNAQSYESDQRNRCPICFNSFKEPFSTKCAHTFCFECISRHLEMRNNCPTCGSYLTRDLISPNFAAEQASRIKQQKKSQIKSFESLPGGHLIDSLLGGNSKGMTAAQIQQLIALLQDKQKQIESIEKQNEDELLAEFLEQTKREKLLAIEKLNSQLDLISNDLAALDRKHNPGWTKTVLTKFAANDQSPDILRKWKRLEENFIDLETRYFQPKSDREAALEEFGIDLHKFAKYSHFQLKATLKHGSRNNENSSGTSELFNASNIVSSIEFDRDCEYIATAGVMKRIKIFEYENIKNSFVEVHYPIKEMITRAKLSCLSWNPYIRSHLISSDYEGVVTLWDTQTCQIIGEFEEHEKRAWSVDFSVNNPTNFASASDDGRVKLWATTQHSSVATIDNRANVCCVKFNPASPHHLAFGSADHFVHYYDLRFTRNPLQLFKGHGKAVSYIKFMDSNNLVSASTDSTLRLWDLEHGIPMRTFSGHRNDKNFVGLSVTSDYIACGSENNSVYIYYKSMPKPCISQRFGSANPVTGEEVEDDTGQFVSSVCWCPNSPTHLLAANSQGTIKLLEMSS